MPDIHILTKFYSRDKSVSEIFQNCVFQCYPEIFGILGIRHLNCPLIRVQRRLLHGIRRL